MREENCSKLWRKTPWPRSLETTAGSGVIPFSAARPRWPTPAEAASCLKAESQLSKLPKPGQGAAETGFAVKRQAKANAATENRERIPVIANLVANSRRATPGRRRQSAAREIETDIGGGIVNPG